MKHILITRFNYPIGYPNLEERIELFNQFTVPSVSNQLCQDFEWAVITNLPLAAFNSNKIIKVKDFQGAYKIGKGEDRVITSRLDNDDAIHTSFIANVQFYSEKLKDGTFIDFSGYLYNQKTDSMFESIKYKTMISPFVSYVEKGSEMRGVHRDSHYKLKKYGEVFKSPKRLWMQIVHSSNVKNKVEKIGKKLNQEEKKEVWSMF